MAEQANVLRFMVLRAPELPATDAARQNLIRDDVLRSTGRVDRDLFSAASTSDIGKLIYQLVFCTDDVPAPGTDSDHILDRLTGDLTKVTTPCGDTGPEELRPLSLMVDRQTFQRDETHYMVPDRLADLPAGSLPPFFGDMMRAVERALASDDEAAIPVLMNELRAIRDDAPLYNTIFTGDGTTASWLDTAKAALFDALYRLYVLRRWAPVNFDEILRGLQLLHTLEALAVDELLAKAVDGKGLLPAEDAMFRAIRLDYQELRLWRKAPLPPRFPLIRTVTDLADYMRAIPVVHPLFARLHGFRKPFNPIRHIGVGDLKVVKQWLINYEVGEIAHVENVLIGETRTKVHRHLEKTEDVFTSSSEQVGETQQDSQTTDRYELKRETENLVKTDLNVNASLGLNVTYNNPGGYTIVTSANGGFAYGRSQTDQVKISSNFAREVVEKAVSRIETRVSQQRTTTKLFETEETNTHGFSNVKGSKHISGIYRWLDKRYRAQVYNYGKRMMFEFLVPEPAAFLVESRMRALEATVELPRVPQAPDMATLPDDIANLTLEGVDDAYADLSRRYDLSDLQPPVFKRSIDFVDTSTGQAQFAEKNLDESRWQSRTFVCRGGLKGYRITRLRIEGYLYFWGRQGLPTDSDGNLADINTFEVRVNGQVLHQRVENNAERWYVGFGNYPANVTGDIEVVAAHPFASDDVTLTFGFWDIEDFDLSVQADLELSDEAGNEWRRNVRRRVFDLETRKVDETNRQREQSYQSDLATYAARRDELRALAVNDLLRSRSEAVNRQLMERELKRQVLAMITRELTADPADDRNSFRDPLGVRQVDSEYHRFMVTEKPPGKPTTIEARFEPLKARTEIPVARLDVAREKGRHVQFLEQAFEWPQLSYLCYPYFHAVPQRWVDLMNRGDDVDPAFTQFLQAGYARVLLAVTPAYDDAVLHYLCDGKPWDGGRSPVIGDPLFIPLHEEMRRQTDDVHGGVPEGDAWEFTLPTSLIYLDHSTTPLPSVSQPKP